MKTAFIIIATCIGFITAAQIRTDDCGLKLQARNFVRLAWRTLKGGDRKLSFDEIEPTMSSLLWPNKFTKEMFDAIDLNKNGVVDVKGLTKGTYACWETITDLMTGALKLFWQCQMLLRL